MSETRFPIDPTLRDAFAALNDAEQAKRLRELRRSIARSEPQGELIASYRAAVMPNVCDACPTLDPADDRQWARQVLDFLLAGYE
ncbi:MAG: hypothetical protein AAF916_11000 [Planctomycetota bacterium]